MGIVLAAIAVALAAGAVPASAQLPPAVSVAAPEQPLPFSHRRHAAAGVPCATCHKSPDPGDAVTIADTHTCMACHATTKKDSPVIQALADFDRRGQPIAWKRVYRVPEDVVFSHRTHLGQADVTCEVCHGPVREMEAMQKVRDTSMTACVNCHREKGAPTSCTTCHESR